MPRIHQFRGELEGGERWLHLELRPEPVFERVELLDGSSLVPLSDVGADQRAVRGLA
jgi:hypothetical protein